MIEIIYEEHLHFIGEVLKVAVVNAPLGFEKATMVFFKIKVEWTTIIVNDTQMMEVRIWDSVGDILYWRASRLEYAMREYHNWRISC